MSHDDCTKISLKLVAFPTLRTLWPGAGRLLTTARSAAGRRRRPERTQGLKEAFRVGLPHSAGEAGLAKIANR